MISILWKCCVRALKENKSRTAVTIIGVAMATVMITVLSCMGSSILTSACEFVKKTSGSAHETYYGVKAEDLKYFLNNQSIEKVAMEKHLGLYPFVQDEGERAEKSDSDWILSLYATPNEWFGSAGWKLYSGRYAEKAGEIVLPRMIRTDLGLDVKIGDFLEVESGKGTEKFEVVGFIGTDQAGIEFVDDYETDVFCESSFDVERMKSYHLINAFCVWEDEDLSEGKYDVSVRLTRAGLARQEEVSAALLGITAEQYRNLNSILGGAARNRNENSVIRAEKYQKNDGLIMLEGMSPFHLTTFTVWIIAFSEVIFLLFVLAGVFCINNSFDISITERIRFFGMLSSVGTTKRQRRMLVWMEAFAIGIVGIPLGILLGMGLTFLFVEGINLVLRTRVASIAFTLSFRPAWWAVLITAVQSAFMIILSAMEAAFRASRITPMEAIRSNGTIANGAKQGIAPKLMKKLFGVSGELAIQNFRRAKVKYRATTTSIAVSVALVLGMTFIPFLFEYLQREMLGSIGFQVCVSVYHSGGYEKVLEISQREGITKAVLQRRSEAVYQRAPEDDRNVFLFFLSALDNDTFEKLCRENGMIPEEVQGKGLVTRNNKSGFSVGEIHGGGIYKDYGTIRDQAPDVPVSLEIGGMIDEKSISEDLLIYSPEYTVFVSEDWAKAHLDAFSGGAHGYFLCEDPDALTEDLLQEAILDSSVENFDQAYQLMNLGKILVMMFMIGFLGLLIATGVTNVINAVNFNMQMRVPEFARLRAVGMTTKQFRRMIYMEGGILAVRGLFWGYFFGIGLFYMLYRSFVGSADMMWMFVGANWKPNFIFHIPYWQIVGCALAVGCLLWLVMNAQVKKTEKKNMIEAIRNENL